MEPSMRVNLNNLQASINGMKSYFKPCLRKAEKDTEDLPQAIQKRLEYLNTEIPTILLRANPPEVKMMTLVINASYKNVMRDINKFASRKSEDERSALCKKIQHHYSLIVKNATQLMRVTPL